MKSSKISASIMCADLMRIEKVVKQLEESGIDYIHIDIIDNQFAKNLTFGPDFVNQLREITHLPFEIHYMVKEPESILNQIKVNDTTKNIHVFHFKDELQFKNLSKEVNNREEFLGAALTPSQNLESLYPIINLVDEILILSVEPGFFGSTFIESSFEKVSELKKILEEKNKRIEICVDGGISCSRAKKFKNVGAHIFVGGTSSVFRSDYALKENVSRLKEALTEK